MTKQKYTFPGIDCPQCPFHQTVGNIVSQTRYCGGFPKRRRPKRFSRSDPQYKPPKWCPRRISPTVCRIYGFVDEESEYLDWRLHRDSSAGKKDAYIFVSEFHYQLRLEVALGLTAKQFYDAIQMDYVSTVIPGADLSGGEVIEIDDGLKPYYFYCLDRFAAVPLPLFDRTKTQKAKKTGGGQA